MTHSGIERFKLKLFGITIPPAALALTVCFAIFISPRVSIAVLPGIKLAAVGVLPSLFPFMIVADLYTAFGYPERIGALNWLTKKLYGLPPVACRALILGNLAGFPIGAKIAAELYTGGDIDKKSAEKLIAVAHNPSIPFIVAYVGGGLLGSEIKGLFLLTIIYISNLLCAQVNRGKAEYGGKYKTAANTFNLPASVRGAASTAVNVVGYITFFYTLSYAISLFVKDKWLKLCLTIPLEVTGALTKILSLGLDCRLTLSLLCAALSFGGLCTLMQAAEFSTRAHLSLRGCILHKLFTAVVSFLLVLIFYPLLF